MTAREIAHKYARKAHMCPYNKHSDRHQEHSAFCDALCKDVADFAVEASAFTAAELIKSESV